MYHGTSNASYHNIIGPPTNVDVTMGGGELGRGLYLGKDVSLAASWAFGRNNFNSVVLEFDIDDSAYSILSKKEITSEKKVNRLWKCLNKRKLKRTFLFCFDVVVAPFATIKGGRQFKFESIASQNLLNNNKLTIITKI